MKTTEMKEQISEIFNQVSFRKFTNAFRKHINPYFTREHNLKSNGGILTSSYRFEEFASYIIGDGSYMVTEEQFKNFMNEFNKGL